MKKTTLANFFAPEETTAEFCVFNQLESTHAFTLKQTWFNRMRPNHLIVVFAEKQTKGIGTHQRTWQSSHLTDFHINLVFLTDQILPFSLLTAISTCRFLHEISQCKKNFKIRWPNDVLFENKKISGNMTLVRNWNDLYWATIGVGINFNLTAREGTSIDQPITSVKQVLNKEKPYTTSEIFENVQLFSDFFIETLYWFRRIGAKQYLKGNEHFWLYLKNNVTIYDEDRKETLEGIFESISDNGSLILTPLKTKDSLTVINGTQLKLSPNQPENYEIPLENFT